MTLPLNQSSMSSLVTRVPASSVPINTLLSTVPMTSPIALSPASTAITRSYTTPPKFCGLLAILRTETPGLNLIVELANHVGPSPTPHTITKEHPMVTPSQTGFLKPKKLIAVVHHSDEVPGCFT